MDSMTLEAPAGQVSAELQRRGIDPTTSVRVTIERVAESLDGARIAASGGAFAWLDDEPDLYSDADVLKTGV